MTSLAPLLLVSFLRILGWLPYGFVARFGHVLGGLLYALPSRRKNIVLCNLGLCFPEKSHAERYTLGKENFRQTIRSYVERGVQWYGNAAALRKLIVLESAIDLQDPDAPPTIFLGFHFVAIEAGCALYSLDYPVAALYSRMSNKRLGDIATLQRGRFNAEMIERTTSAREIVRHLKTGTPVMLAADLDHGIANSLFVPFFGMQACTLTSVARLARLGKARVVPFVTEVMPDFKGYKLTIHEPLTDFPTGDDMVDATRTNAFLEKEITRIPAQYYWVHRRFKNQPEGMPKHY